MISEEQARNKNKPERKPLPGLEQVKNVLAVASGKGGVGKTTIAVNVALALAAEGCRVGLLDADVYGPSVPVMLNLVEQPGREGGRILPVEKFGLRVMSLGMIAEEGQALIWRGPMVGKAIRQLLGDVFWGELDFMVVDLPPGTGDPSITVAQSIRDASVLMVTTPQKVAVADVRRAIRMFRTFDLNIIGLIENMSYFRCSHSPEQIEVFGSGGGEMLSQELGIPLLGSVPIDPEISASGDAGFPLLISAPDSAVGRVFHTIGSKILGRIVSR